ncbi:hypothetical protein GQ53DRAFT_840931 [Thozetella sp. PMI_491]|nr:hypothetical protein GQ53DRAFT_840931 [Thozetella sp. PMI_491]
MKFADIIKFLEVKHDIAQYAEVGASRWGNKDIYPVLPERRTYTAWSYVTFCATAGICVTSWTLGSSMITVGLTAGESVGAVLIGSTLAGVLTYGSGMIGRKYHVGFMMMCRMSYGLVGAYIMIGLGIFQTIVYFGIQAYYGGQAVVVVLNAIFPQFLHLTNTLPESAGITTQALIGFMLYLLLYIPILFVPVWHIDRFLYPTFIMVCFAFAGIIGYFVHENGGTQGNWVTSQVELSRSERVFTMMSCVCSVAGTYTGGTMRMSDWTRFSKTYRSSTFPIILSFPITITLGALIGVVVTSAGYSLYGQLIWSPLLLLQHIQESSYTPACRAGTFFAGLALLSSQIFVNLTQNSIPQGMDMVSFFPRFFTIRRGAMLAMVIGTVIQPWRFLSQAKTFLTVLSSFGVFTATYAGVTLADFWLIRRQNVIIPDLYRKDGSYWYHFGVNWRGFTAFLVATWPSLPGFVSAITGKSNGAGWTRIYQFAYFIGLVLSVACYWSICRLSPPPNVNVTQNMHNSEGQAGVLELVDARGAAGADKEMVADASITAAKSDSDLV